MENAIKVIEKHIDLVQELILDSERAKDGLKTLIEDLQKQREATAEIGDLRQYMDDLSRKIKNAKDDIERYRQQIESLHPR